MTAPFPAHYLDGRTAARQAVTVRVMPTGLELTLAGGGSRWWPIAEVRQTQGYYAGEPVRLERGDPFPEVLLVDDRAFLTALDAAAPSVRRRLATPGRRWTRIQLTVLAGLAALALSAALYVWAIPLAAELAASHVPVAWEERLGEAVVAHLAPPQQRCADADREAVIAAIVTRLQAPLGVVPYRFRVIVLDTPAVNALAAPGGSIVLLRGLLERTRSAEELAGILAHEMQHVLRRHGTKAILRHASSGLLVAAIAGDVSGIMTYGVETARFVGSLHYSRQAEEEADREGLRMLLAARIDPAGMLSFFDDLRKQEPGLPAVARYLATHPAAADRAEALRRLASSATAPALPLLPERDWKDVTRLCAARR